MTELYLLGDESENYRKLTEDEIIMIIQAYEDFFYGEVEYRIV